MSNLTLFQNTLQAFSFRTANELYTPGKNLVYSPASLSFALGLLLEGTGGLSREEIIKTLIDPRFSGEEKAADEASGFLAKLGRGHPNGIQKLLTGTNIFYSDKSYQLIQSYVKAIKDKFSAAAKELDFENAHEEARKRINSDVKVATKGLIPELLSPNHITKYTKSVLINAIYFKGLWAKPFDHDATNLVGAFHLSNGRTVRVPMMNNHGKYELGECPKTGAKLLRLPYHSGTEEEKAYMVLVLPKDGRIKQYLTDFNVADFNEAVDKVQVKHGAEISFPRFKIGSTHDQLITTLRSLGIEDVFGPTPNLSKMTQRQDVVLSVVIQKAVIECNEEGTKAAAATAIVQGLGSAAPARDPPKFIADRPFVYAIVTENAEGLKNILFTGVVENPKEE